MLLFPRLTITVRTLEPLLRPSLPLTLSMLCATLPGQHPPVIYRNAQTVPLFKLTRPLSHQVHLMLERQLRLRRRRPRRALRRRGSRPS